MEDVDAIAEHRARIFEAMGQVPPKAFETLRAKSRERFLDFGWLAIPALGPNIIAGGAEFNSVRFCRTRSFGSSDENLPPPPAGDAITTEKRDYFDCWEANGWKRAARLISVANEPVW